MPWGGRRHHLQRLFSAFPAGHPGYGLLLLRLAAGGTAAAGGVGYFVDPETLTVWTACAGLTMILAGVSLIAGLLTPFAAVLLTIVDLCRVVGIVPIPAAHVLTGQAAYLLRVAVALALAMIGPGAMSIDAYLFGRREIVIPQDLRSVGNR